MKSNLKTTFILLLLIAFMFLSPICMASDVTVTSNDDGDDGVNGTYEFIASDVYKFDEDVVIDSIIDGNAFAFGDNVTITGEIGGDVFVCGRTVTIEENAYVHGSIFVLAQDFKMNGICYDIYGCVGNTTLGESAIVARDIRVVADTININGQIKRDAYINTNELIFLENASNLISGNLDYTSSSELAIDENIVGGSIKFTQEVTEEATMAEKILSYITEILSTLLYSLAVVLLTVWLAPNFRNKVGSILKKKAPLSFGVGLLASIIIIFAAIILLIFTNGLGASISLAAIAIFILACTISQTVFGMSCAKLIAEKCKKDNLAMFIGMTLLVVLLLKLIGFIPFVGGLIGFVSSVIGLGTILLNLMTREKTNESKPVEISTSVNE